MGLLPIVTATMTRLTLTSLTLLLTTCVVRGAILRTEAEAKGKYFGSATLTSELKNDATYKSILGNFVHTYTPLH